MSWNWHQMLWVWVRAHTHAFGFNWTLPVSPVCPVSIFVTYPIYLSIAIWPRSCRCSNTIRWRPQFRLRLWSRWSDWRFSYISLVFPDKYWDVCYIRHDCTLSRPSELIIHSNNFFRWHEITFAVETASLNKPANEINDCEVKNVYSRMYFHHTSWK